MARFFAPALAVTLALGLTACGGEKKQAGAGKAEGEVLPGSASDAMLPLDTVKSQALLAPRSDGGGKGEAKEAAAPGRAQQKQAREADQPAEPAPAAAAEDVSSE